MKREENHHLNGELKANYGNGVLIDWGREKTHSLPPKTERAGE